MAAAKPKVRQTGPYLGEFEDEDVWRSELLLNPRKEPRGNLANAMMTFQQSPVWEGVFGHDAFAHRTVALKPPPWERGANAWMERPWSPHDDVRAAEWMQLNNIPVGTDIVQQAVEAVSRDHSFHPVSDFLCSLEWDGMSRLEGWLAEYLGAARTPYTEAVARCSLIAAVARILRPGVKVDTVTILEGPQGVGKSSALKILGGKWFTDEIAEFGSKDAAMQIAGAWFIEIAELDSMSKAEVSRIKAFISRTTDRYRPAFGRRVIESARQSIFWGSTNGDTYLKDETGGRRFWPVATGKIKLDALAQDRDQLFAEAVHRFKAGESWWLTDRALIDEAIEEQGARYTDDPWQGPIQNFCHGLTDTSIAEILWQVFEIAPEKQGQREQNRVAACLRTMGLERYKKRVTGNKSQWRYRVRDGVGAA